MNGMPAEFIIVDELEDITYVLPSDVRWRLGFDMARVVKGVLVASGCNPATVDPKMFERVIVRNAENRGLDGDEIYGQFWEAWGKVRCPAGRDPMESAAIRADGTLDIPGEYPNSKFKHDAARVFQIAIELSITTGYCFLPCQKLADVLDVSHMRAARLLRTLVANGLIEKVGVHTRNKAQTYKLNNQYYERPKR